MYRKYNADEVLETYLKESRKRGYALPRKEIIKHPELPSYDYILKNIGGIKELRKKYNLPQKIKEKDKSKYGRDRYIPQDLEAIKGLPLFCEECLHKTTCPCHHDLDKCQYTKEVC